MCHDKCWHPWRNQKSDANSNPCIARYHANTADRCRCRAETIRSSRPARPQLNWLDRTESAQIRETGANAPTDMPCISSQAPADPATRLAFVLIDGLGDTSVSQLGDRTPLQAANTPILDGVAGYFLLFTAEPCHILLFLGCCMRVLQDSTESCLCVAISTFRNPAQVIRALLVYCSCKQTC